MNKGVNFSENQTVLTSDAAIASGSNLKVNFMRIYSSIAFLCTFFSDFPSY